jgi:hypothetical protein
MMYSNPNGAAVNPEHQAGDQAQHGSSVLAKLLSSSSMEEQ